MRHSQTAKTKKRNSYLGRALAVGLLLPTLITGCEESVKQTPQIKPRSQAEGNIWNADDAMHNYMRENYGERGETAYATDRQNNIMEYSLPVQTKSGRAVFVYRSNSIFARVYLGGQGEPVKIDCDGCRSYGIEKVTIPAAKEKLGQIRDKAGELRDKVDKAGESLAKKAKEPATGWFGWFRKKPDEAQSRNPYDKY